MMGTTANRLYPYPAASANVRPYADIQALAEAVDADIATPLFKPPHCHLVQQSGAAQTGWTTLVDTPVTFGASSEVSDTDGLALHDTVTNNSRIIIGKRLGWWEVSGVYVPAQNTAQVAARALIGKNGASINGSCGAQGTNSGGVFLGITTPVIMVEATNVADYVDLRGVMQAASGTLGTAVNSYFASSLTAVWKRPS